MIDPILNKLPCTMKIKVTPKAKKSLVKLESDVDGGPLLKVYVTAPPADGKANAAVIALLAKTFGVAKSQIEITQGLSARHKTVLFKSR